MSDVVEFVAVLVGHLLLFILDYVYLSLYCAPHYAVASLPLVENYLHQLLQEDPQRWSSICCFEVVGVLYYVFLIVFGNCNRGSLYEIIGLN